MRGKVFLSFHKSQIIRISWFTTGNRNFPAVVWSTDNIKNPRKIPGILIYIEKNYAKNGVTIAVIWSLVRGSSKASDAAAADIGKPPIFVIVTPACITFSSPS